jgi:hypothetical protein
MAAGNCQTCPASNRVVEQVHYHYSATSKNMMANAPGFSSRKEEDNIIFHSLHKTQSDKIEVSGTVN